MKIGILGGTGNMGRGLAIRWALKHEVLLGSRSLDRARKVAQEQENVAKDSIKTRCRAELEANSTHMLHLSLRY